VVPFVFLCFCSKPLFDMRRADFLCYKLILRAGSKSSILPSKVPSGDCM
jgi:hypothetical protein